MIRFGGDAILRQKSELELVWSIAVRDHSEEQMVQVRFDNATAEGIPFPRKWYIAAQCTEKLPLKGPESAENARVQVVADAVECTLLGRPRPARAACGVP